MRNRFVLRAVYVSGDAKLAHLTEKRAALFTNEPGNTPSLHHNPHFLDANLLDALFFELMTQVTDFVGIHTVWSHEHRRQARGF